MRAPSPPAPPQWETPRIGAVPHFEGGRWNAGTDWIDSRWVVGPGTARLGSPAVRGYSREACVSLGTEFGPRIRLWERDPGVTDVPPFLILAASEVSCHYVSAGSFGDAMDLASRWAQAVTAEVLSTTYQELTDGWESRHGILTTALALARANEGDIEHERPRVLHQRAEAHRKRAERQARQAVPHDRARDADR